MTGSRVRIVGGLVVMAAAAVVAYPVPLRRWYRAWRVRVGSPVRPAAG